MERQGLVRELTANGVDRSINLQVGQRGYGRAHCPYACRFTEWFKSPLAKFFPEEDLAIERQEEENTIAALKNVLAPLTLRRETKKTFHGKSDDFMIWLPLSPWQEVLCDTVREKEVERWAGVFGINPMNGLCPQAALQRFSYGCSDVSLARRTSNAFCNVMKRPGTESTFMHFESK